MWKIFHFVIQAPILETFSLLGHLWKARWQIQKATPIQKATIF